MNITDLVKLHKGLSDLVVCFMTSGVPDSVSSEDLERIEQTQQTIEKVIKYMKVRHARIQLPL